MGLQLKIHQFYTRYFGHFQKPNRIQLLQKRKYNEHFIWWENDIKVSSYSFVILLYERNGNMHKQRHLVISPTTFYGCFKGEFENEWASGGKNSEKNPHRRNSSIFDESKNPLHVLVEKKFESGKLCPKPTGKTGPNRSTDRSLETIPRFLACIPLIQI